MPNPAGLEAATQDRRARLAQLKSLKRKQPSQAEDVGQSDQTELALQEDEQENVALQYTSGRNYDAENRAPRLGFETAPGQGEDTIEAQAALLALTTKKQQEEEEKSDAPLDLFKLQPKKPNWDLKRDLQRKLEVLNVRTDNAIASLVRERIEKAKEAEKLKNGDTSGDGEALGMEGKTLVEATKELEREAEIDREQASDDDV